MPEQSTRTGPPSTSKSGLSPALNPANWNELVAALNSRLEAAEKLLASIPWKTEVTMLIGENEGLMFTRLAGNWCLMFDDDVDDDKSEVKHWSNSTVEERTLIASHLQELLESMTEKAHLNVARIREGLRAIQSFESRVAKLKEGQ